MSDVVKFVTEHYGDLCAALVALAVAGGLVARLTPTPKDDAFFARVLSFLQRAPSLGLQPAAKPRYDA